MEKQRISADPSYYSYYIDDQFYEQLLLELNDWDKDFIPLQDEKLKDECQALIYKEARLLDDLKLDQFLSLYTKHCLYWAPITPGGGDPRKEVSLAFDDRRRLEDRVYRLRTGYAHSQIPLSRTRRMLTNMEMSHSESEDQVKVRCNFIMYELRVGKLKSMAGWYGYRLKKEEGSWKIEAKLINLVDCDQGHENLTFML